MNRTMNRTIFRCSLDIHDIYSQFTLPIKKGDTSGRLVITLMENGKPYHIVDGCYAIFAGKKENGALLHNACIVEKNTIVYDISKGTTSTAGKIGSEIILYDEEGQELISPRFTIVVHDSIYSEATVEESGEYLSLINVLSEAKAMISNVETKLKNGEFKGERGFTGAKVISTVLIDQDENGDYIYEQTFEDGSTSSFIAPRGATGAKIVSTELIGQDENGGNIYEQTFDNGVKATFTAPKGERGYTGAKVVSTELKEKDEYGNNIYEQTFDDGSTATFISPKGDDGKTPTLQDWLGTKSIGDPFHFIYYNGETFVERPISINDETTEWYQISLMADQISKGEKTPEELGLAVGQERNVTLSTGEEVTFVILGFNHDDLSDGSGKAGITFGMKGLLSTKYIINDSAHEPYSEWAIRDTLTEVYDTLPSDLRAIIKDVTKLSNFHNYNVKPIDTTVNKLFLFSVSELFSDWSGDGSRYEYYASGLGSTKKFLNNGYGSVSDWATRSRHWYSSTSSTDIMTVDSDGNVVKFSIESNPFGICFGFCI